MKQLLAITLACTPMAVSAAETDRGSKPHPARLRACDRALAA